MSSDALFNDIVTAEMAADPRGDIFLELAASLTSSRAFGSSWHAACCYLAAFLLNNAPATDADSDGAVGPVTSRHAGKESESWGLLQMQQQTAQDAALMADPYGKIYIMIRNTRAAAGPTTTQTAMGNPTGANWPGSGFGGVW